MANSGTSLPIKDSAKTPNRSPAQAQPFESIRREFDRLFEELDRNSWFSLPALFGRAPARTDNGGSAWMTVPAVDVVEREDAYEIIAEMPGMDEKDIEVALVNGGISIHGEKRENITDESADHYLRERRFGSFERSFALPEDVSADKIAAKYANGVLHVTLPKNPNPPHPKRRIAVTKN